MLRLPTGMLNAQGVKANVLFFDKKPAGEWPWTERLWVDDLRTNRPSNHQLDQPGGNDPYGRLKRALKADIDAEAWESLHRT
jgi:hypothetical protein